MKVFTFEHIFNHPWEEVVTAAFQKYPNPLNPAVIGLDVIDRQVKDGVLHSHRLVSSKWFFPRWAQAIIGSANICYASEKSEVHPTNRQMILKTVNVTFNRHVAVDEKLCYVPDPNDANKTILRHEACIRVEGVPLGGYMEDLLTHKISVNASKGRQAMEWVINKLSSTNQTSELITPKDDILNQTKKSLDEITITTKKSLDEMTTSAKKQMDDISLKAKKSLDDMQNFGNTTNL